MLKTRASWCPCSWIFFFFSVLVIAIFFCTLCLCSAVVHNSKYDEWPKNSNQIVYSVLSWILCCGCCNFFSNQQFDGFCCLTCLCLAHFLSSFILHKFLSFVSTCFKWVLLTFHTFFLDLHCAHCSLWLFVASCCLCQYALNKDGDGYIWQQEVPRFVLEPILLNFKINSCCYVLSARW